MNTQNLMSIEYALQLILKTVPPMSHSAYEPVNIDAAHNRICSHDITAPISIPPFAASAMDGYAINSEDPQFTGAPPYQLRVQGRSLAGHPFHGELQKNCCIRITTGACIPARADAIVIQENAIRTSEQIEISHRPEKNAHIRNVGQDVGAGQLILSAGSRLGALQLGWLQACGIASVNVLRKLKVSVFSTGDELSSTGKSLAAGEIYDANRLVLIKLMEHFPVIISDLGILPDDEDTIRNALGAAAEKSDIVLSSGGVSVGDADYVRNIVSEIGHLELWKIAIKPGKPVAFGKIGKAVFFGLPGNPVSAIVTYLLLAKPAIEKMCGKSNVDSPLKTFATLEGSISHSPGRTEFQRATCYQDSAAGGLQVSVSEDQSSNRFASFRDCNCLIELSSDSKQPVTGDRVTILPLEGLLT